MKYLSVAMLAIIFALCMVSMANSKPAEQPVFVCQQYPDFHANVGIPLEIFAKNDGTFKNIDGAKYKDNKAHFKFLADNIIAYFDGTKPPYPVDEIQFYESTEKDPQFYLGVFVFKGCVMNYQKFPINTKSTIIGTEL